MFRLRLPIPTFKVFRLLLPLGLLTAGLTIFLCGMVRTYYITEKLPKVDRDEKFVRTQNDYTEWWVGFLLMASAVLAMIAVVLDKPLLFKLAILACGFCFVITIFAVYWDAGEFSEISRDKRVISFLESEGHKCETQVHNFTIRGVEIIFNGCECQKDNKIKFDFYVFYSCEVLLGLYYAHAFLAFAMACAIGCSLFTLFSFVLILKRISQISTALHLDEKPLSEDFNISGDLYIDS